MEEPELVKVKEEDKSDNESSEEEKEEVAGSGIVLKEENCSEEERQTEMVVCDGGLIKEEAFFSEGGSGQQEEEAVESPNVRKSRKPGPRRKRRRSDSSDDWSEAQGNKNTTRKGQLRTSQVERRTSQRVATPSSSVNEDDSQLSQPVFLPRGMPVPQTYRDTEVETSDKLLHCDECAGDYEGDCPEHGPLLVVEDIEIDADIHDMSRATRTAPAQVSVTDSKIPGAGCGIRAREIIPARTRFGPFEGNVIPLEECTSYSWLIRKDGKADHCVDATEPGLSNWMRYVNCSRNEAERNLQAFQYQGKIYYRTICQVDADEELLVWCGKEYGRQLGIHLDAYDDANAKNSKESDCRTCPSAHDSHSLNSHDTSHLQVTPKTSYKCPDCSDAFSSLFNLESHKKRFHLETDTREEKNPPGDDVEDFSYYSQFLAVSNGSETSQPYGCGKCTGGFADTETLKVHFKIHDEAIFHWCKDCKRGFSSESLLKNHYHEASSLKGRQCVCGDCNKIFSHTEHLKRHLLEHKGLKPFLCLVCKKEFNRIDALDQHVQSHIGDRPYSCQVCNKPFPCDKTLAKHQQSHAVDKCFSCDQCDGKYHNKWQLERHMRTHEKPFACKGCSECFATEFAMNQHSVVHVDSEPFACCMCNRVFVDKETLITHSRTHSANPPVVCPECNREFAFKVSLRKHLRAYHRKEKPFACAECDWRFTFKWDLTKHMKCHTGEKPFVCPTCNSRFTAKASLKAHQRSHTGEKPFLCPQCHKSFTRKESVKVHLEKSHCLGPVAPSNFVECNASASESRAQVEESLGQSDESAPEE